jgi:general secretion pathway protein D
MISRRLGPGLILAWLAVETGVWAQDPPAPDLPAPTPTPAPAWPFPGGSAPTNLTLPPGMTFPPLTNLTFPPGFVGAPTNLPPGGAFPRFPFPPDGHGQPSPFPFGGTNPPPMPPFPRSFTNRFPAAGVPAVMPGTGELGPAAASTNEPEYEELPPRDEKAFLETPVGIKYKEVELDEVLKDYSDWTGLAIMKAPDVPAVKITLKCPRKIPRREALLAIEGVLAMHGIGLVPMGDKFVKVVPIVQARQYGMETRVGDTPDELKATDSLISQVIELKYIEIPEAQTLMQNLLHSYGKIIPMERINALLVTDTAINIERIREILERLDQPMGVREEMRIIPIRHAKASEIQGKLEAIIADAGSDRSKTGRAPIMPTPGMPPRPGVPGGSRPGVPPGMPDPTAESAAPTERGLVQGRVKIVADDRTNCLIIMTRPEQFAFLETIIQALDQQVDPDMTIKVVRLEYAPAKDVLSVLTSLIGSSGSSAGQKGPQTPQTPQPPPAPGAMPGAMPAPRPQEPAKTASGDPQISGKLSSEVKILSDERTNSLLIMADKTDMRVIEEVLSKLDILLSQVLIEVVIIEVGLKNNTETGVDWLQRSMIAYNEKAGGSRSPFLGFAGASRQIARDQAGEIIDATGIRRVGDNPTSKGSGLTYFFTLFDLNVDAVLNMLAATSEARILSTPIILTTDNKEAKIIVGEKRPIITSTTTTTGGNQQSAYEYVNIGIELNVTPHINRRGFVVMEIKQKIDNVSGEEYIDGNKVPIIITREFGASLAVDDSRTIVVGGLVSNQEDEGQRKIPLLGDIPLIRYLFGSQSYAKVRRELLVLITPYVLNSPDEVRDESARRYHSIHDTQLKDMWKRDWSASELATPPEAGSSRPWYLGGDRRRNPDDPDVIVHPPLSVDDGSTNAPAAGPGP